MGAARITHLLATLSSQTGFFRSDDIGAYARDLGPISLQLGPRVEAVRLITQSTSDFS